MPLLPTLDPEVRLVQLAEHHVSVPMRQSELLALFGAGLTDAEATSWMRISIATVRNHSRLARAICIPGALEPTRENAQTWALLHRGCCLASAFAIARLHVGQPPDESEAG